jgi:hypothetical protein
MQEKTQSDGAVAHGKHDELTERKHRLLLQAEMYRVGIVHARVGLKQAARPEALFHQALDHAGWALRSRVDRLLHPTGVSAATLMPFAMTVIGFITRRRLVKPALGILAVGAAVALYVQRRHNKPVY